jgi:hypothetical protein
MPRVPIEELLVAEAAHLDAARVERYATALDELPPVVVFDTGEGLLLADGYHRVAAARRRGAETVDAEIRRGSRSDALRYAAVVGAEQRGVSVDVALRALYDNYRT